MPMSTLFSKENRYTEPRVFYHVALKHIGSYSNYSGPPVKSR